MAFYSNNQELIFNFLEKGGNLNLVNDLGFTPIVYGS